MLTNSDRCFLRTLWGAGFQIQPSLFRCDSASTCFNRGLRSDLLGETFHQDHSLTRLTALGAAPCLQSSCKDAFRCISECEQDRCMQSSCCPSRFSSCPASFLRSGYVLHLASQSHDQRHGAQPIRYPEGSLESSKGVLPIITHVTVHVVCM